MFRTLVRWMGAVAGALAVIAVVPTLTHPAHAQAPATLGLNNQFRGNGFLPPGDPPPRFGNVIGNNIGILGVQGNYGLQGGILGVQGLGQQGQQGQQGQLGQQGQGGQFGQGGQGGFGGGQFGQGGGKQFGFAGATGL